jgi:hypothetical protein
VSTYTPIGLSGIAMEIKSSIDMRTQLYRFQCRACARRGAWLEQRTVAERNGRIHIEQGCEARESAA